MKYLDIIVISKWTLGDSYLFRNFLKCSYNYYLDRFGGDAGSRGSRVFHGQEKICSLRSKLEDQREDHLWIG